MQIFAYFTSLHRPSAYYLSTITREIHTDYQLLIFADFTFCVDKEEELHPVIENKFGDFNLYDITHLCHAIGNHTVSRKNIYQIASFAKACFPAYTNGQHMHSIAAKLTNTDRATIIPVLRRNDPLPDFSEM